MRVRVRSSAVVDRVVLQVDVPAVPSAALPTASATELERAGGDARARGAGAGAAGGSGLAKDRQRDGSLGADRASARGRAASPGYADAGGRPPLVEAAKELRLSARALDRIVRVARRIVGLAGLDAIQAKHVAEAVQHRAPGWRMRGAAMVADLERLEMEREP